jgi:hypothetical protein
VTSPLLSFAVAVLTSRPGRAVADHAGKRHTTAGGSWWALGPGPTVVLIAALIALAGVFVTNIVNMRTTRLTRMGDVYANALQAVSDYLEAPYRVRRKDGTAERRHAISSEISDVQSRMDHSAALLRLHAPAVVADAYDSYVRTAKDEAGPQISEAWDLPPVKADSGMHVASTYPRTRSAQAREALVDAMQADLHRWGPWGYPRPQAALDAPLNT